MSRYIEYEPLMAELEREVELLDDWKTAHEIANVVKYAPTIKTKSVKYFDDDERVWKVGSVIVDE